MKTLPCVTLEIISVLLLSGCYSTTEVTTYRDISEALPHSVRIMTVDTTVYTLEKFSYNDSLLEGEGERLVAGHWQPFSGRLPMSRIVYIQTRRFNVLTSIVGVGLMGMAASWIGEAAANEGLDVWRPYGGTGGSCPFVYAWNGSRYVRQGEVFGSAIGKALETSTGCMLPDASAPDGILRMRIADERPETHYINSVRVCGYETAPGTHVYLDTRDRAWPVTSPLPPLRAPAEIMRRDNVRWKSDAVRAQGGYRDVIEVTLPGTAGTNEGSLLVHAVNTHFSDAAFETLFGYLGDESLPYLYRIEHDNGTAGLVKDWIEECGLHVDVWDGASWEAAGVVPPEANEVSFSRVVRLRAPAAARDSLRIRLRALADTWEIDAVEIDWSPALPLQEHVLPLLGAWHSRYGSVDSAIRSPDSVYAMLLPGESVDVTFRALEPREGYAAAYACHASGYLYEWPPEGPVAGDLPEPGPPYGAARMNVVEYLLRNHDAMLPVLFARWDAVRHAPR